MDYLGSKESVLPWIRRFVPEPNRGTVFIDGCSGTGSVSRMAAQMGYSVVSVDNLDFSKVACEGSIGVGENDLKLADDVRRKLNNLSGTEGYFYRNFSEHAGRPFFTNSNAARLDEMRQAIDEMGLEGKLRSHILYCLLKGMSRSCNSAGTHVSHLKEFKPVAKADLMIRPEQTVKGECVAYRDDLLHFISSKKYLEKVLYIDPPINERQYCNYYHLYDSLVLYDDPVTTSMSGKRDMTGRKSDFSSKHKAFDYLRNIISSTRATDVFTSYNSDGILRFEELDQALSQLSDELSVHIKVVKRYRADDNFARNYNRSILREYLFHVKKKGSIL